MSIAASTVRRAELHAERKAAELALQRERMISDKDTQDKKLKLKEEELKLKREDSATQRKTQEAMLAQQTAMMALLSKYLPKPQ